MDAGRKRVLIVGAGTAGKMVLSEIRRHKEIPYKVEGFIDDNAEKQNKKVNGIKVCGNTAQMKSLIKKFRINILIIAIPTAKGDVIRKIINQCKSDDLEIKIVPGIWKIISGAVKIDHIREVKPEDLLGRETVKLKKRILSDVFSEKTVLVTGAAGSIGSEICSQLLQLKTGRLVLLDQNESELFYLQQKLKNHLKKCRYIIADVDNISRINNIFRETRPDIVFHAAAYKHVPLMEDNVYESVRVNVRGSYNIFKTCEKYKVKYCILISSDKAVNPTSVMGACKRLAEKSMLTFSQKNNGVLFSAVRFGNVLGSRGSVVPLFQKQIKAGGPVTITHPEIYRYFMTVQEAVTLVLNTVRITKGNEIFVLDMGSEIRISDLAHNLIVLSGLKPGRDIKIKYTGLRPGEKLYEEFLTSEDKVNATKYEKIYIAKGEQVKKNVLNKVLKDIFLLLENHKGTGNRLKKELKKAVPEYVN